MNALKFKKWLGLTLLCVAILSAPLAQIGLQAVRDLQDKPAQLELIQDDGKQIDMIDSPHQLVNAAPAEGAADLASPVQSGSSRLCSRQGLPKRWITPAASRAPSSTRQTASTSTSRQGLPKCWIPVAASMVPSSSRQMASTSTSRQACARQSTRIVPLPSSLPSTTQQMASTSTSRQACARQSTRIVPLPSSLSTTQQMASTSTSRQATPKRWITLVVSRASSSARQMASTSTSWQACVRQSTRFVPLPSLPSINPADGEYEYIPAGTAKTLDPSGRIPGN
jgi:hypothetical protein